VLESDLLGAESREDGVIFELRAQFRGADELALGAVEVLREEVFAADCGEEGVEFG
jgi:hypothetical protein